MYFKGNVFLTFRESSVFPAVRKFMNGFTIGGEIINKLGVDGFDIQDYSCYIIETAYTAGYNDCTDVLTNAPTDKEIKFTLSGCSVADSVILFVKKRKDVLLPALYILSMGWYYELFVKLPLELGNEIVKSVHTLAENAYNAGYNYCLKNFKNQRGKKNGHKKTPC